MKYDLDLSQQDPIQLNETDTRWFAVLRGPGGTLTEEQRRDLFKYVKITFR